MQALVDAAQASNVMVLPSAGSLRQRLNEIEQEQSRLIMQMYYSDLFERQAAPASETNTVGSSIVLQIQETAPPAAPVSDGQRRKLEALARATEARKQKRAEEKARKEAETAAKSDTPNPNG